MSELATLFVRQNEHANMALLDACRDLTDEQLDATVDGVFGSIRDTFGHIVSSEQHYAGLLGQNVGAWDDESDAWPGWREMADMIRRAADGLAIAATEPPDRLIRSTSGDWDIEAAVIVIQAVHHGADHRSQINTILTHLGLEPTAISSWAWGEVTGKIHPLETDAAS
jgi:uncharacterized damage-inducible protein DinB